MSAPKEKLSTKKSIWFCSLLSVVVAGSVWLYSDQKQAAALSVSPNSQESTSQASKASSNQQSNNQASISQQQAPQTTQAQTNYRQISEAELPSNWPAALKAKVATFNHPNSDYWLEQVRAHEQQARTPGWLKFEAYTISKNIDVLETPTFKQMAQAPSLEEHLIVKLQSGSDISVLQDLGLEYDLSLGGDLVKDLYRYKVAGKQDIEKLLESVYAHPSVVYAEPDYTIEQALVPSDPNITSTDWWLTQINAYAAWDEATDASAIGPIGIFDNGILKTHEDLVDNLWVNVDEVAGNGVDDDGNGYIDDVNGITVSTGSAGHGTPVAGTVCGQGNNDIGYVGSAWECQLMELRSGLSFTGTVSDFSLAMPYAVEEGSRISNHSWRIYSFSLQLAEVVDALELEGHLLVAAAGNEGNDIDAQGVNYPARLPNDNILTVAASTTNESPIYYSSYGPTSVDIAAPTEFYTASVSGDYAGFSGTSQAAPVVTGAVALAWSLNTDLSFLEIKQIVLDSARPVVAWSGLTVTGGILDMEAIMLSIDPDTDGDGILDSIDPDDDNDGVVDELDAFPRDPTETVDTDGDGVGDNADLYPLDPTESADSDGDGVPDNTDAFPNDPTETVDTDGDGVGDNSDAFPNESACWLPEHDDGTGQCDFGATLPNFVPDTITSDVDGTVYLFSQENSTVYRWSVLTQSYLKPIPVGGDGITSPLKMAYAPRHNRLYFGYGSGVITYINIAEDLVEQDFASTPLAVEGIIAVGEFLLAQDSTTPWDTHYIFDRDGELVDSEDWNRNSIEYAWNEFNNRVYFFRNGISPNDLHYEEIDQTTGEILSSGETPYHGTYLIRPPIRISNDGVYVLLGSGDIYDANDLTWQRNVGLLQEALWLNSGDLVSIEQAADQFTLNRRNTAYTLIEQLVFTGTHLRTLQAGSEIIVISEQEGSIVFTTYVPNPDSDGDGVDNNIDAFPLDPTETVDTDGDGVGDNADLYPLDPTESADSDGDGVPDNTDAFPNDPTETVDTDGDGVGDNSDAFPNESACWLPEHDDGTGQCDFGATLPNFVPDTITSDVDGTVYLFSQENSTVYRWSVLTQSYLKPIPVGGDGITSPLKMAYAPRHNRLYFGYGSGVITYINIAEDLVEQDFASTPLAVEGIIAVGEFLLAQDSTTPWDTHYIFDRDGELVDSQAWNRFSIEYAWNEFNNRVYFFRNGTSPNDLHYEEIDQTTGEILSRGETPYHGTYLIRPPIRVSNDGVYVLLGSGDIYDANDLTWQRNVGAINDGLWLDTGELVTIVQGSEQFTLTRLDSNFEAAEQITFDGTNVKIINSGTQVIVVSDVDGELVFTIYTPDYDTDGDGVPDSIDAFPNDPTETLDSDGDGVGDNADAFPSDPSETTDSDGDGVGDNADAFPNDPTETVDSDGDGIGDNADPTPNGDTTSYLQFDGVGYVALPEWSAAGDFRIAFSFTYQDGVQVTLGNINNTQNFVGAVVNGRIRARVAGLSLDVTPPLAVGDQVDVVLERIGSAITWTANGLTTTGSSTDTFVLNNISGYDTSRRFPYQGQLLTDIEMLNGSDSRNYQINQLAGSIIFPDSLSGQNGILNDFTGSGGFVVIEVGEDTDGDGVPDSIDAFPNDPTETLDSDGDGVGDNADVFPTDPSETVDTDGDGVGDNADAFPSDPTETVDSDGDGIGDNADPTPNGDTTSYLQFDGVGYVALPEWSATGDFRIAFSFTYQDGVQVTLGNSDNTQNFVGAVVNGRIRARVAGLTLDVTPALAVGDRVDVVLERIGSSITWTANGLTATGSSTDTFALNNISGYDASRRFPYQGQLLTDVEMLNGSDSRNYQINQPVGSIIFPDGLSGQYGVLTGFTGSNGFVAIEVGVDTDGDGVPDSIDAFPNDPTETLDSDGDGVGDNADAFPTDPSETVDTDGDGVGDNADAYPNDPTRSEAPLTIQLDFGNPDSVAGWNTVARGVSDLSNLLTDAGVASNISLQVTTTYGAVNVSGGTSSATDLPAAVSSDSFWGRTSDSGSWRFTLTGLSPASTYSLALYGSRDGVSDNRETQFEVQGLTSDVVSLSVSNNIDNTANVTMVPTAAGTIEVIVSAGLNNTNSAGYYYLGALTLVQLPDTDGDGVPDSIDEDVDGDNIDNSIDADTDGDGIPNLVEVNYGLNPNDASDGSSDLDGDSWSNVDEYRFGSLIDDASSDPTSTLNRSHQKVFASDNDRPSGFGRAFGRSISISGNTAVISGNNDQLFGFDSGDVYVFELIDGLWVEQQKLLDSNPSGMDGFGISVAIDGDIIFVGADEGGAGGATAGSVYIYGRQSGVWTETQRIVGSDAVVGDGFGGNITVEGDTAVISAYGPGISFVSPGSVYVFNRLGDTWIESQKLTASDGTSVDNFGFTTSLFGDTLFVSSHLDDDNGDDSGSVYVFDRVDGVWSEGQKLLADDGATLDYFGQSISLLGDLALIGSAQDDVDRYDTGSVYVFARNSGVWSQQQQLVSSNPTAGDLFGSALSLSENMALISSRSLDEDGNTIGAVYIYTLEGTTWNEEEVLVANDSNGLDGFGSNIALSGNTALISFSSDDDNGALSGSAYFFDVSDIADPE